METPDKDTIGSSRRNSLSSGDPKLNTDESNTSTDSTSSENSGESVPQTGENIVNEQEQHKSVNMEEFVDNTAQNRFEEGEEMNAGADRPVNGENDEPRDVPEIGDDPSETSEKMPTMSSGAL